MLNWRLAFKYQHNVDQKWLVNNKFLFEIISRIMSWCEINSRQSSFAKFFAFKFLIVAIYVACFVNLFIKIKITSLILSIYEFLADGILIMKFMIIVWNESSSFDEIKLSSLYDLWWWTRTRWQSKQMRTYSSISNNMFDQKYFLRIAFSIQTRAKWFKKKSSWWILRIFFFVTKSSET